MGVALLGRSFEVAVLVGPLCGAVVVRCHILRTVSYVSS